MYGSLKAGLHNHQSKQGQERHMLSPGMLKVDILIYLTHVKCAENTRLQFKSNTFVEHIPRPLYREEAMVSLPVQHSIVTRALFETLVSWLSPFLAPLQNVLLLL